MAAVWSFKMEQGGNRARPWNKLPNPIYWSVHLWKCRSFRSSLCLFHWSMSCIRTKVGIPDKELARRILGIQIHCNIDCVPTRILIIHQLYKKLMMTAVSMKVSKVAIDWKDSLLIKELVDALEINVCRELLGIHFYVYAQEKRDKPCH